MLATRCPTSPVAPPNGAGIPLDWLTLRAEFDDEQFARFVVLGLGTRARAIEPDEFRRAIVEEATAVAGQTGQTGLGGSKNPRAI